MENQDLESIKNNNDNSVAQLQSGFDKEILDKVDSYVKPKTKEPINIDTAQPFQDASLTIAETLINNDDQKKLNENNLQSISLGSSFDNYDFDQLSPDNKWNNQKITPLEFVKKRLVVFLIIFGILILGGSSAFFLHAKMYAPPSFVPTTTDDDDLQHDNKFSTNKPSETLIPTATPNPTPTPTVAPKTTKKPSPSIAPSDSGSVITPTKSPNNNNGFLTYSNTSSGYGISIEYPNNWGYRVDDQGRFKIVTFGQGIDQSRYASIDKPSVGISVDTGGAQNKNLQEYYDATLQFIESTVQMFDPTFKLKILTSSNTISAGRPAKQFSYLLPAGSDTHIKTMSIITIKESNGYVVSYTINQTLFDANLSTPQYMIGTFKIL